jgi:hypothetical protein
MGATFRYQATSPKQKRNSLHHAGKGRPVGASGSWHFSVFCHTRTFHMIPYVTDSGGNQLGSNEALRPGPIATTPHPAGVEWNGVERSGHLSRIQAPFSYGNENATGENGRGGCQERTVKSGDTSPPSCLSSGRIGRACTPQHSWRPIVRRRAALWVCARPGPRAATHASLSPLLPRIL